MERRVRTNNKLISMGTVCLLVITGFLVFTFFEPEVVRAGNTIYVGSGAGNHTDSIQDAIDNFASDGDTVFVYSGTYFENVEVNKTINLIGENNETTIIDGGGIELEDVIRITVDWVNVSEFTLTNVGIWEDDAGIQIESHNNTISGNNISQCATGIFVHYSNNNKIIGNTIFSSDYDGIHLNNSNLNTVLFNAAHSNGGDGIRLRYSHNNSITCNNASNNFDFGIALAYSLNNRIENNTCNSNDETGIRLDYSEFNTIENNTCNSNSARGIEFYEGFCYGNNIRGNNISHNTWNGIDLKFVNENIITGNTVFSNGWNGIDLGWGCYGNTITGNNIFSNNDNGIRLHQSIQTEVRGNIVTNNGHGIFLEDTSSDNKIVDNNVSSNTGYGIRVSYPLSINNLIEDNNVLDNGDGIYIYYSGKNNIKSNIVYSNSRYGIYLDKRSNENNITGNYISDNLEGINLSSSSNINVITLNNISANGQGIVIDSSNNNSIVCNNIYLNSWYGIDIKNEDNNTIYHNNFIDNNGGGVQAKDNTGTNHWNDSYPSGGNYWNDWTTPDTMSGENQDIPGSDGFVDFPYFLDGGTGARDYLPFSIPVDILPPVITNLQPPNASITNDNTPTISADYSDPSGINVSSVILEVDGVDVTSSATVTASNVTYIPGIMLSDGIHTVYLEVKDIYGNLATVTWSFTVDTEPPIITNLQPPDASITNNNTTTISADYSDPSGINVSSVLLEVDGIDVTSSTMITASNASYIPGMALSDGVHTVSLEVKDNLNNPATVIWSFTVDTIPPTIILITPGNNSVIPNGTLLDFDIADPNLAGVTYSINGGADLPFSGPYDLSTASWPDGNHIVRINALDLIGNSNSSWYLFTIDSTPPTITNLLPPDSSTTIDSSPTISADYNDLSGINVSSVMLKVDGIDVTSFATVTASGVSYIPVTVLSEGIHTVYLGVEDNVGNLATITWSFTVDTTPPIITNLLPHDSSTTNDNTSTIGADYSDPSGINVSSVVLEVDGIDVTSSATVTLSNVSYLPMMALSEGIHTIYLEVKDNAGNLATTTWSFTVDTTPPTITNLQPPDSSTTNNSSSTIGGNYTDPSGINLSSVLLKVDGIDVTSSVTITTSGVSYLPGMALSDGVHTVYLEVIDNVGNLAMATWSFTVDTTPPTITNLQPPNASTTNDSNPMISANYSDLSGINVSSILLEVDGIDVTISATVTTGNVSYIPGEPLSEGIHTVYIEVKDSAGNLATVSWSFTVDTTPPIITNFQPPDTSTTNDSTPIIGADYNDPSGINISNILLKVDGIDVTFFATVTTTNVSYIPGTTLSDGVHTVYLEVWDNAGNLGTVTWSFTVDTTPPIITNLQPPDTSVTNDSTPSIGADYSDPSGIDVSSVLLEVDGTDVTFYAMVMSTNVTYLPEIELSDSSYTIYLEVKDNVGNLATATWSFTVDTIPPIITNLQPPNDSMTNDNISFIGADYSDPSGINASSVLLEVDGVDVTLSSTVTTSGVSYVPGTTLSDGSHTVYLEVKDNVGNLAMETWSFSVDTIPPITTISPDNYTVKSGTIFTLTATDNVGGCGVNYTQYRIDDGQWIDYLGPFSIDVYEYHNITYRSVDYLGNIENENKLSIYVPKAPITTLIIGIPHYGSTPRYVNYFTQFSFSVVDYSGTDYDTYYYIDSSPSIQYIGPFAISTEGTHTIYYYSIDNLGNIEDTKEFDIIVDNTPPTTLITINDPYYISGDTWVTSATEFTLNTIDGGLIPVGINLTMYRIWNGVVWTSWNTYSGGFSLGTNEGPSYLEFYSIDWLGNEEPIQNRSYIVDDTPPTGIISLGNPKYKDSQNDVWNVTSATTFALSGIDDGVGFNYTEYRIWNNGSWCEWYKYTDGFNLGSGNGTRYVEWHGVDYLGNKGVTCNETYFIDNIPPETNYLLLLEPDNTEARLSLIPGDIGSGVDFTKYRIGSGNWITYTDTFVINKSGEHVIYFFSVDKLGNIEDTKEVTVLVEKPVTPIPTDEDKKETNQKPLIALIFSIILLIVGSYVSYKRPLNFKGEVTKDRFLTWFIVVLPFVIAEIATGIVSHFTGMLSVPPLLGIGMIVDTAILVGGLVADGWTYKKGQELVEESFK